MNKKQGKDAKMFSRDDIQAYALIAPFFIVFTLFVLYPVVKNIFDSLTNSTSLSRDYDFIGLNNYAKLARDGDFIIALKNTVIYALFSVVPLIILGFLAAVAVNKPIRGMVVVRSIMIFPYVISMVAVSMVWLYLLDPTSGIFNRVLSALNLPRLKWLFDEKLALPSLIDINIWKNIGYVMIIYLAGINNIPTQLYEAAKVDGAGSFRILRSITLPMVQPITYFILITMTIESFKTFEQVRVMTDGGPVKTTMTLVYLIYKKAFLEYNTGYAAAIAVLLLLIVFIITLINMRINKQSAVQ